jgi:hypothetical protein
MNPKFIKNLNLFERIVVSLFVYGFIAFIIASRLVVYGWQCMVKGMKWVKVHIAAWFDKCVKRIARNGYIFSLSEYNLAKLRKTVCYVLVAVFIVVLLLSGVAIRDNIEDRRVETALENVTFVEVVAGKGDGEYYTWWSIAEEFCPDFMQVANFCANPELDYLELLYSYNGGHHVLRAGERVIVPILK